MEILPRIQMTEVGCIVGHEGGSPSTMYNPGASFIVSIGVGRRSMANSRRIDDLR